MAAADKAMCQEPLAARGGPAASLPSPPSPHTTLPHRPGVMDTPPSLR